MKLAAIIILVVLLLAMLPLISIWACNILFDTAIEYNLATWFAALWLTSLVGSGARK